MMVDSIGDAIINELVLSITRIGVHRNERPSIFSSAGPKVFRALFCLLFIVQKMSVFHAGVNES